MFGSMVALVTPMLADGAIDYNNLKKLLDWHLQAGTQGIVLNGTTGESPTVSFREQMDILNFALKHVDNKIRIIAGSGTNSTEETIRRTREIKNLGGIAAALVVTPYYNRPTNLGLTRHYQELADKVEFPIILYNVPTRTATDLTPDIVLTLAKQYPHIIGLKESDLSDKRLNILQGNLSKDFVLLSGNDPENLACYRYGGHGVISVTANVAPKLMRELCDAAAEQNWELADELNNKLQKLNNILFVQSNPIPVKWALSIMGKINAFCRLPLTELDEKYKILVENAIEELALCAV